MSCSKCFHPKDNHKEGHFCTGSIDCMCQHYEVPVSEFVNEINRSLTTMKKCQDRVKFILEKIPNLRNAGEKKFARAYRRLVYGLNQNDPIPRGLWLQIPHDDTINRAKRRVQQLNPSLAKDDHRAITMAGATQEGIMEALYT